ncbi:hypothetical protein [Paenibacillus sp. PAMC 26794]|uniref:hypothetical protein n=1 Tax=Paenibacillus sp. PAMC 26794 TaxID=1257080 RepID=UPI000377AF63|nr:hypothetical protein [Paenibacillus sp. PAMC 26794]
MIYVDSSGESKRPAKNSLEGLGAGSGSASAGAGRSSGGSFGGGGSKGGSSGSKPSSSSSGQTTKGTGNGGQKPNVAEQNFSSNFDKKIKKHAQDIYETSRDLGIPVKKGDKEGMKDFVSSIVKDSKNLANSKPFEWNTIESVNAYVKGDAVVLVNRKTNEIFTFLNKKGDRLSSKLKSVLDLIGE